MTAVLLAFFVGCASEEPGPEPEPSVEGIWAVQTPDSFGCLVDLILSADGAFERSITCPLKTSGHGLQVTRGKWRTLTESRLQFSPRESSCPLTPAVDDRVRYQVTDTQLRLEWTDGLVTFERLDAPDDSVVAQYGCFDSGSRVFTANPIEAL